MSIVKSVLLVGVVVLGLFLLGCRLEKSSMQKYDDKMQCVALIGATDKEVQQEIADLFRQNGIKYYTEGSIVYCVYVPQRMAKKASALLLERDSLAGKWRKPEEDWK